MSNTEKPKKPVCRLCGSEQILLDKAPSRFNVESQKWESLDPHWNLFYCYKCDKNMTGVNWVDV